MEKKDLIYDYNEIQKGVLKSILFQQDSIPVVSEIISSEDFSNDKYKAIYKTCLEMYSLKEEITQATLFTALKETRNIDLTLEDVVLFTSPPLDPPVSLANILKQMSVINQAIKMSNTSIEEFNNGNAPLETLGKMQTEAAELSFRLNSNGDKSLEEEITELKEEILKDKGEEVYVIPSPYETLNRYINKGFMPEQLITVGARTGIGKTVVATQAAATACALGKSVLFFSLEMSSEQLIKRIAACHGNIMLSLLRPRDDRDEATKEKISSVMDEISNWKLKIVDSPDVTMEKIRSISQQTAQSETGLDMIIIDYLQLISTKGSYNRNRQETVAEISRSCKMMAKELGVPVMVLVQLNREGKGEDADRLPGKEDIRESAAIAADSDIVLIIHRKSRDDSTDPKALFILDKNREGASDKKFLMRCVLEKNIFQDLKKEANSLNESDFFIEGKTEGPEESHQTEPPTDFANVQDVKSWGLSESSSDLEDVFDTDIFGDM